MIVSLIRTVYFLRLKAENTAVTQAGDESCTHEASAAQHRLNMTAVYCSGAASSRQATVKLRTTAQGKFRVTTFIHE